MLKLKLKLTFVLEFTFSAEFDEPKWALQRRESAYNEMDVILGNAIQPAKYQLNLGKF